MSVEKNIIASGQMSHDARCAKRRSFSFITRDNDKEIFKKTSVEKDVLLNAIYLHWNESQIKQLGYNTQTENPSNNELSVYGNNIIKKADEITNSDYKVTLYAIWEEYPVITAKNASLLSTDFNKLDIDSFKDYVLKSVDTVLSLIHI